MNASELLARLEDLEAQGDLIKAEMAGAKAEIQAKINALIPPELLAELEAIDAEFDPLLKAWSEGMASLEAELKEAVILTGETVKGESIMAVYSPGRQAWDTKGLTRYAKDNPEVMRFYQPGKPSVAIRRAK